MLKIILATLTFALAMVPLPAAADLQADLLAMEKTMWTAWGKKDGTPFKTMLTADAVEVVAGTAPVVGRDAIVKSVTTLPCELKSFAFADGKLRKVSADVAIVSYTATQDATCEGKKLPPKLHSTAIYVKQKGKWLQTSYQETPIE
jgi:uncharacterized protein (TIGR02246 family)